MRVQKKITMTQPSIGEIARKWDELLKDHDQVFYLPLSRELSRYLRQLDQPGEGTVCGKVIVVDSTFVRYPVICCRKRPGHAEKGYM
ncbi:MAG: hypothetical protein ACLVJ6_15165 [Merdibacter sp.]